MNITASTNIRGTTMDNYPRVENWIFAFFPKRAGLQRAVAAVSQGSDRATASTMAHRAKSGVAKSRAAHHGRKYLHTELPNTCANSVWRVVYTAICALIVLLVLERHWFSQDPWGRASFAIFCLSAFPHASAGSSKRQPDPCRGPCPPLPRPLRGARQW